MTSAFATADALFSVYCTDDIFHLMEFHISFWLWAPLFLAGKKAGLGSVQKLSRLEDTGDVLNCSELLKRCEGCVNHSDMVVRAH